MSSAVKQGTITQISACAEATWRRSGSGCRSGTDKPHFPCVCHDELDIRPVCMEDGDTYHPWRMDQKLGKIRKKRVVSKAGLRYSIRVVNGFY